MIGHLPRLDASIRRAQSILAFKWDYIVFVDSDVVTSYVNPARGCGVFLLNRSSDQEYPPEADSPNPSPEIRTGVALSEAISTWIVTKLPEIALNKRACSLPLLVCSPQVEELQRVLLAVRRKVDRGTQPPAVSSNARTPAEELEMFVGLARRGLLTGVGSERFRASKLSEFAPSRSSEEYVQRVMRIHDLLGSRKSRPSINNLEKRFRDEEMGSWLSLFARASGQRVLVVTGSERTRAMIADCGSATQTALVAVTPLDLLWLPEITDPMGMRSDLIAAVGSWFKDKDDTPAARLEFNQAWCSFGDAVAKAVLSEEHSRNRENDESSDHLREKSSREWQNFWRLLSTLGIMAVEARRPWRNVPPVRLAAIYEDIRDTIVDIRSNCAGSDKVREFETLRSVSDGAFFLALACSNAATNCLTAAKVAFELFCEHAPELMKAEGEYALAVVGRLSSSSKREIIGLLDKLNAREWPESLKYRAEFEKVTLETYRLFLEQKSIEGQTAGNGEARSVGILDLIGRTEELLEEFQDDLTSLESEEVYVQGFILLQASLSLALMYSLAIVRSEVAPLDVVKKCERAVAQILAFSRPDAKDQPHASEFALMVCYGLSEFFRFRTGAILEGVEIKDSARAFGYIESVAGANDLVLLEYVRRLPILGELGATTALAPN